MWVIGFIAAVQVFAAGWAVISRESLPMARVKAPVIVNPPLAPENRGGPLPQQAVVSVQSDGEFLVSDPLTNKFPSKEPATSTVENFVPAPVPNPVPPPVVENSILPSPNLTGPAHSEPLGAALANAADSVEKIEDLILARLVSAGEEFRTSGNMVGALKALHEAESALPNHPRILSNLAGIYTQWGQQERAMSYWEKVIKLGPDVAGGYYSLAERALRGEQATPVGATTDILKIRGVRVNKQVPGKDGQWVSLHVTVEGDPSVNPLGDEVDLIVSFYDMVDGKKIETSTADTSYKHPTAPYDWQDKGVEEIEVIYHQPVFTEEQKRELGERVYHGYVIELYFRDQFQDTRALPAELHKLRIEEMDESQKQSPDKKGLSSDNPLFPSSAPAQ